MEQWRSGSRADRLETVVFEYSTDAANLNSGTWTSVASLDLVEKLVNTTVAEKVDGNDPANRTEISGVITLRLPAGGTIWLRWKDADATGSDGLYALDDFLVKPTYSAVDNAAPTLVSGNPAHGATNVPTRLDLVLTFNEPVTAGTGQLSFVSSNETVSLGVTDADIQFNGNEVTVRNILLKPAQTYSLTIDNAAFKDASGNFYAGIASGSYTFTTSASGTPVLSASVGSFDFPLTQIGITSAVKEYDLSAQYLQEGVTVSVSGPFEISKSLESNVFTSTSLTFSTAELATSKKVYVRFKPSAVAGNTGAITHSTAGGQTITVSLTGTAFNPNVQNFEACGTELPGGWKQYSVAGAQTWGCTTYGRTGNAVQVSGYSSGNQENEDWLISPAIDLTTGYQFPLLSYWTRTNYNGATLRLMVSANYSGSGAPNANGVTWTELKGRFPEANSDAWTETKDIDLSQFKGSNVYIAYVYTSTTSAAARWTLDDFEVKNSVVAPPAVLTSSLNVLANADFGIVSPGTTVEKTFTFSLENVTSGVALEVAAPFSLSKNGADFTQSISFTQAEIASNSFTVRFTAPVAVSKAWSGRVTFWADNLNQQVGYLTGAVLNKDNTFDVVTWNIEWFGSTGNGPSDEDLQKANVKKVIEALDADVYAFQEISNADAFNSLKTLLPAYEGFMSEYASNTQEVAFFYKKATVTEVKRKYLLKGGTGVSNFWASGRYPYLLEVDATVNGVIKRLHLINIHAKANESDTPEAALTAYNRRKDDVRILKDSLDAYYPNASIIMVGDYNDDIDFTVADLTGTTESTYKAFAEDAARYTFATMPLSLAGLRSYVSRENVIDHVLYSNELADFYIANSARIVIPFEAVGTTTAEAYANTTSDHLPTIARFNLAGPLGVEEESWAAGFRVYPNPTKGTVALKLPAEAAAKRVELTLYSVRGEVLLKTSGTQQNITEQLSRKLGASAAGMYLVKVQAGSQTYQTRIIRN